MSVFESSKGAGSISNFFKKPLVWVVLVVLLAATIGFAAGYLWRGEAERAPIIIEKHSGV